MKLVEILYLLKDNPDKVRFYSIEKFSVRHVPYPKLLTLPDRVIRLNYEQSQYLSFRGFFITSSIMNTYSYNDDSFIRCQTVTYSPIGLQDAIRIWSAYNPNPVYKPVRDDENELYFGLRQKWSANMMGI